MFDNGVPRTPQGNMLARHNYLLLNQFTQSSVSISAWSSLRQGPSQWVVSVLQIPMTVSASALSYESQFRPRGFDPHFPERFCAMRSPSTAYPGTVIHLLLTLVLRLVQGIKSPRCSSMNDVISPVAGRALLRRKKQMPYAGSRSPSAAP